MVTLTRYLQYHTGLNVERDAGQQDLGEVYRALPSNEVEVRRKKIVDNEQRASPVPRYLEAIYDAGVGIDRDNNRGFDRPPGTTVPDRLNAGELLALADLARTLRHQRPELQSRYAALNGISTVALDFSRVLRGEKTGTTKNLARYGIRHTLIGSKNGAVFEMLNSMSSGELHRFRRKIKTSNVAVEDPYEVSIDAKTGETKHKVVLGKGGFGIARIARNIATDQYVAVKKTHPFGKNEEGELVPQPVSRSKYSRLDDEHKNKLQGISDAVILPLEENHCVSKHAIEALEQSGLSPQDGNAVNGLQTVYSFSELGITNLSTVTGILYLASQCFEDVSSSFNLSDDTFKILKELVCSCADSAPSGATARQVEEHYKRATHSFFNSDFFLLKNKTLNKKYRNTMALSALEAMAKFHGSRFTHNDIKPENVVLTERRNGDICAKLIDLDSIEADLKLKKTPLVASVLYESPEHALLMNEEFMLPRGSKYDAEKSDMYGIGISLRLLAGFNTDDVFVTGKLQKARALLNALDGQNLLLLSRTLQVDAFNASALISATSPQSPNWVPNRNEVRMSSDCPLKYFSDLLLQVDADERPTAAEILESAFFRNQDNFMNPKEVSNHTEQIVLMKSAIGKIRSAA